MSTSTRIRSVIDGYDVQAERARYAFPDVEVAGARLNRGTSTVSIGGDPEDAAAAAGRDAHARSLYSTTHDDAAPVLELGYPVAGHFVQARHGTYMDLYLGVAQKLLDENHPRLLAAVDRLGELRLALRREIVTDDYYAVREGVEGVVTTGMLADLVTSMARDAFPRDGGYRVFFSSSGTEANEAAIKLAQRVRWCRLREAYGDEVLGALMAQLGIGTVPYHDAEEGAPLYADYPLFTAACEGAFHGRTLGSLHLTRSKKVHQVGYAKSRWTLHVPFNGAPDSLEARLDPRPLNEIVAADGGVPAVLDQGRVPAELVALFVVEGFQGEGGYTLADPAFLKGARETCTRHGILYVADEVQTFGRTGAAWVHQHHGVAPDVLTMAKGAWVGCTVAPAELERYLEPGWHSNTWGGGKVFDNTVSFHTLQTLTTFEDPVFEGRTYLENERVKGEYLRETLAALAEAHPTVAGFSGLGCMYGLTVYDREDVIARAWKRGLKLLGAGAPGEEATIRLLFLADVLTHEIDQFAETMDAVLTDVES